MNNANLTAPFHRLALLILPLLGAWPLPAQTNPPPPAPNRYLLIVDTAAAMNRRAPATLKAVESLFRSSLATQLQRGDTVGVWTFNEQLYAGRFPLQTWTPETSERVAANVVGFLKAQTNSGQSRFEVVVPTLRDVVADSRRLTVLLVSDGDERISGTPFDAQIERAIASKFQEQQKARMPFITVLRAQHGEFVNATVNLAPWPVEFPQFPPEPEIVEAPKPEPKPEPPPPRPTVPPLILVGKKSAPTVATNVLPVETTNASAATAPSVEPDQQPPPNTRVPEPEATPNPASTPAPIAAVVPNDPPVQTPAPVLSAKTAVETEVSTSDLGNVAAAGTISPPPVEIPPTTPVQAAPILLEETPPPSATTNASADVTVAVAADAGSVRWLLIAAGTGFIIAAVGALLLLQRRAQRAGHGSLITRSLDRDRK